MATNQGINIKSHDFVDFACNQGWPPDNPGLKNILMRLREIYQTDPDYYAWILHDRPIGTDVRYPWVGLVQVMRVLNRAGVDTSRRE